MMVREGKITCEICNYFRQFCRVDSVREISLMGLIVIRDKFSSKAAQDARYSPVTISVHTFNAEDYQRYEGLHVQSPQSVIVQFPSD